MAIGRAIVHCSQSAHAFSAGIKRRHCIVDRRYTFCCKELGLYGIYCRFTQDFVEQILRIYRKYIFAFFNFANWPQHGVQATHLKRQH